MKEPSFKVYKVEAFSLKPIQWLKGK